MLMLMNAWMMLVLMKCKCQMQCLTLGCYKAWQQMKEGRWASSRWAKREKRGRGRLGLAGGEGELG